MKLLIVCNHAAISGSNRYYGSGDKMFLIHQVTSREHVFKSLGDLHYFYKQPRSGLSPQSCLYFRDFLRSKLFISCLVV